MAVRSAGRARPCIVSGRMLLAVVVAVGLPAARAACYLMDANADCAVCWRTTYRDAADKTGVTRMGECPAGLELVWTKPLPARMNAMVQYVAGYSLALNTTKFGHLPQGDNDIPHANIHSCIASRGACTPFVSNSPGLATHTEAKIADFEYSGDQGFVEFSSDVQLTEEQYTIIAHVRFFARDLDDPSKPNIKYDVAVGVSRLVEAPVVAVSSDSWISTGVAGGILLVAMGSVVYAVRQGRVDMDAVMEAVYSTNTTLAADLLLGVGDTLAYTVGVFTIIQPDNELIQILPAAVFFMVLAWMGSLYNAYYDAWQLFDVFQQARDKDRYPQTETDTRPPTQRDRQKDRPTDRRQTDSPCPIQCQSWRSCFGERASESLRKHALVPGPAGKAHPKP